MSLKCCLFKLKKDQFSSYYISNLNEEKKNETKNDDVEIDLVNDHIDKTTVDENNINFETNTQSKLDTLKNEQTVLKSEQQDEILNQEENEKKQQVESNQEKLEEKDELRDEINSIVSNKKLFKQKPISNNVKFSSTESEEKIDSIDDLPVSSKTNEQAQINKTKLFAHQMSVCSEAPSIQSSINQSLNINQNQSSPMFYYELKIKLKEGKNLAIRDLCGSSDPYAKFVLNGVNVYKSKIIFKNLNPEWNEEFVIKLTPTLLLQNDNLTNNAKPKASSISSDNAIDFSNLDQLENILSKFKLKMFVYDYDRGFLNDDLIGYANIDLSILKENIETSLEIELEDEKLSKYEYLGVIMLSLSLSQKISDEKENLFLPNNSVSKLHSTSSTPSLVRNKRAPYQLWQCVLNVVLIEGNNLLSMDDNGFSDPYVKFKLENERYRSKTIRRCLNPKFLEQFQLYIYDTNKMNLYITVHDYDPSSNTDDFMGKACVDLKTLEYEKTNFLKIPLEDGAGTISLLLTITGTWNPNESLTDSDLNREEDLSYRDNIIRKYGLLNSLKNIEDVGWLQVKVIRAENLASADINGKSDPFCSIQLINQYVQTHTEYKTLNPEWGKKFEFIITDIHAVLEITVLDEDKNKVYEFLGKIEIPIINIQNGKRKLYVLKDRKLLNRAKGTIELEMNLIYNPLKAVIKTLNPREEKCINPEPKLKVPVLKQNIMRVHNLIQGLINTGNFIDSCFRWDNPTRSLIAFITFILIVLNFEIYMLPLTLLMVFFKNYVIIKLKSVNSNLEEEELSFDYFDEEEENIDPESKEPKKSFRERLAEIQEICLKVQETLDYIASLGERVINTFLFTTPWLSWLAIIILIIASLILYTVPLRYLILAWGINKFTKKFRKPPDYVDNTEVLDFLSRVPSKKELFQYKEFRLEKNVQASNLQSGSNSNSNTNKKKKKS